MTREPRPPERISSELIETICERLEKNRRVRRFLPERGKIHLERRLPFLCVYRTPPDRPDSGTSSLIPGQSAHLVAPGKAEHSTALETLLTRTTARLSEAFGAFFLLEVWSARANHPGNPDFTIVAPHGEELPVAVEKLADALREVPTPAGPATVEVRTGRRPLPPSLPRLLPADHLERFAVLSLGLELRPFFRDPESGMPFPRLLRSLQRELSLALQRGFYAFMRLETTQRPPNYHVLGRGAVLRVVWEVDRALAAVDQTFDLLLAVTPYNMHEAWEGFRGSDFEETPNFRYRPLTFDPAALKRSLYNIILDPLEDPALAELFRDKRNELDLQLTMLENRDTLAFLYGGLQVYGGISERLRKLANGVLSSVPPDPHGELAESSGGGTLDAEAFARLARAQVAAYPQMAAEVNPSIEIRDDVTSIMVSRGDLLISAGARVSASRADALLQHEVGTHMLTYSNGTRQPLHLLRYGLPRYEELQAGLAVLAELLTGGLSRPRIRLLAARVVASDACMRGATFVDAFRLLHRQHGFTPCSAFHIAMRVYRGGGFVKDHVYLKGLARLMHYLENGGAFRPLWVGKLGFEHVKVIEELLWRGVIEPPRLQPRYLGSEGTERKLEALRKGISPLDLLSEEEAWTSASS